MRASSASASRRAASIARMRARTRSSSSALAERSMGSPHHPVVRHGRALGRRAPLLQALQDRFEARRGPADRVELPLQVPLACLDGPEALRAAVAALPPLLLLPQRRPDATRIHGTAPQETPRYF